MKVFQILNGFCHWDATTVAPSTEEIYKLYSKDLLFVDAPDYVFPGWGYDDTLSGDERFIQPIPPEGWLYDPETGTFYPEDYEPGEDGELDVWDELAAAYSEGVNEA